VQHVHEHAAQQPGRISFRAQQLTPANKGGPHDPTIAASLANAIKEDFIMQHPLLSCEELLIRGIPASIAIYVTALLLLRFFRRYVPPLHKKLEALEPPQAGRLRLATWNVANLPKEIPPEGLELRLKNMAAVILLSKSDIVVMQEIKVDHKKWAYKNNWKCHPLVLELI
jgi:hypothetical protein